ncbi:CD59 glycoprotein-like isoform X2 [Mustelus asterias]
MENILLRSLLVLSLCSVGSALSCFECNSDNDAICPRKECAANYDACLNVTIMASKQVLRRCWMNQRCHDRAVRAEFGTSASWIMEVSPNW